MSMESSAFETVVCFNAHLENSSGSTMASFLSKTRISRLRSSRSAEGHLHHLTKAFILVLPVSSPG